MMPTKRTTLVSSTASRDENGHLPTTPGRVLVPLPAAPGPSLGPRALHPAGPPPTLCTLLSCLRPHSPPLSPLPSMAPPGRQRCELIMLSSPQNEPHGLERRGKAVRQGGAGRVARAQIHLPRWHFPPRLDSTPEYSRAPLSPAPCQDRVSAWIAAAPPRLVTPASPPRGGGCTVLVGGQAGHRHLLS